MKAAKSKTDYIERFAIFSRQALFRSLDEDLQQFIRKAGFNYFLSFQELRQVAEIAVDLKMWGEPSLPELWRELEQSIIGEKPLRKKEILKNLKEHWLLLQHRGPDYLPQKVRKSWSSDKKKLTVHNGKGAVLGMCPVASDKTICCNLRTIDTIQGCGFNCSYCSIQTFYNPNRIIAEANLAEKLQSVDLYPQRNYHIGSGQASDSLILGNRNGILEAQLAFARTNPNIILEFKTKSNNIDYLLETNVPQNLFISWSLNTQVIIENEEHGTASLRQRLKAARIVADKGIRVGFHFHPIVRYNGWKKDYQQLIKLVLSMFTPDEVALVSFGTLTFIKPAIKNLRLRSMRSKVLQMPMVETAGKFSYPMSIKEELFATAWNIFHPWHDRVFFYFCMEERELWDSVFGYFYESNVAFEESLFEQVSRKLRYSSQSRYNG